ncbi:MAG: right-handed parallel beta-helix repeat-containing protein [Gemmataceae bacterium]|nr:right-handed parallel beta-helix repeat-containing protein [Gemmataceae bacterium]
MPRPLLVLVLAAVVAAAGPAGAADYYLSAAGDDSNPGTSAEKPWKTIPRLHRAKPGPGDRVLLRGGDTFAGPLTIVGDPATEADGELVITSYGTGKARVEVGPGNAVEVRNVPRAAVRNLRVTGGGRNTNRGAGVLVLCDLPKAARLGPVAVEGVEASGFGMEGVCVRALPTDESAGGFDGVTVRGCRAFDNGRFGILVEGNPHSEPRERTRNHTNVVVENCVAHHNTGDPDFLANHSGSGILVGSAEGGRIEGCIAYENGELCNSTGGGPCGIWSYASRKLVIRGCAACRNRTGKGIDGAGFDFDGGMEDSVIEHCYSSHNDGAGYLLYDYPESPFRWRNNVVRFCVSEDDGRKNRYGGFSIGTHGRPLDGLDVYHNTVYVGPTDRGGTPAGVLFFNAPQLKRVRLLNNALGTAGGVPAVADAGAADGVLFAGNGYWAGGDKPRLDAADGLAAWRATKQEVFDGKPTGIEADPLFDRPGAGEFVEVIAQLKHQTAYRLRDGSPFRAAGLDLKAFGIDPGKRTFGGAAYPPAGRPDIGAMP